MITRRTFIGTVAGGFLAAPLNAQAQRAAKIYRVGVLGGGITPTALRGSAYFVAFRDALAQFWLVQNSRAAEVALRHRIAAIWGHVPIAEVGGFMAFAPDIVDQYRQAAGYVKKILDGAKPGDLPLQFPSKWTLAVNVKTAKGLGLTIPPSLLLRADEVFQ